MGKYITITDYAKLFFWPLFLIIAINGHVSWWIVLVFALHDIKLEP